MKQIRDYIPKITLSISDEVYKFIKKHKEIHWREGTCQVIEKFSKKLELLEKIEYQSKIELFNKFL